MPHIAHVAVLQGSTRCKRALHKTCEVAPALHARFRIHAAPRHVRLIGFTGHKSRGARGVGGGADSMHCEFIRLVSSICSFSACTHWRIWAHGHARESSSMCVSCVWGGLCARPLHMHSFCMHDSSNVCQHRGLHRHATRLLHFLGNQHATLQCVCAGTAHTERKPPTPHVPGTCKGLGPLPAATRPRYI
jgi:hypothetical protein